MKYIIYVDKTHRLDWLIRAISSDPDFELEKIEIEVEKNEYIMEAVKEKLNITE